MSAVLPLAYATSHICHWASILTACRSHALRIRPLPYGDPMQLSSRRLRRIVLPLAAVAVTLMPSLAHAAQPARPGPDQGDGRDLVVRTDDGWVRGSASDEGRQFLGMPYAEPPTGDLRWQAPK